MIRLCRTNKNSKELFTATLLIALVFILTYSACAPKPAAFVVVREGDFRTGWIDLPLSENGKEKILTFLIKGGVNSRGDYVIPNAPKIYDGLIKLLSDPAFLYISNFRDKNNIDKISKTMSKWFKPKIIHQLIDATKDRPSPIPPLALRDLQGNFWWIFLTDRPDNSADKGLKITQVLITLVPAQEMKQYAKTK